MIRAILFDIDQTLLNHLHAVAKALEHLYWQYDFHHYSAFENFQMIWNQAHDRLMKRYYNNEVSFSEQQILRLKWIYQKIGIDPTNKDYRCQFDRFLQVYEESWCLFDDVFPLLENLRPFKLGIISNGESAQQRRKLNQTQLSPYFQAVTISDDIGIAKPDPTIFQESLSKLKTDCNEAIYIGDSISHDIDGARNAGITGVLIDRSLPHKIKWNGLYYEINSLTEIRQLVANHHSHSIPSHSHK